MRFTGRAMSCVIALTCALAGCSQSSGMPPSPTVIPPPSGAAPVVTDVLPSVGSAAGGTSLTIVGTGFRPEMVAMLDGIKIMGRFDSRDTSFTTFYTETPAHAVGTVDLVVSNPDGQSHRVAGGYTYAPPDSFDPNGSWGGYSLNGTDTWVEFVIRDKRIVSASCWYDTPVELTFAELPSVEGGEFSVVADAGATISGRIVSGSEMAGTISVPSCTTTPLMWRANRRGN
jgi:IPT/TIG domain-containing protein